MSDACERTIDTDRGFRIALHTGKGGVGKTTVSTATAIAAAMSGRRTLLLSADPAHSVADVLDQGIGAEPVPVDGVSGLWAAQVDARGRFERAWSAVRDYLVGALAVRGVAPVQAEELTVLPGAEEIVALLEVERHAASGEFDAIVLDCAPTGETLRLLALPETLQFYARRIVSIPGRLLRGLAGLRSGPDGQVTDALTDLLNALAAARALLTDPQVCGIRLVLTPQRVVVAEARRLYTALNLHGFTVESVVVNRLLPADVPAPAGWRTTQESALAGVAESFAGLRTIQLELAEYEPVGVPALRELAGRLFAGSDPFPTPVSGLAPAVEEQSSGYALRIPLPLADRGAIDLVRSGDDLVITVGEHRRRLTLPALLQRCNSTGARFEGDQLVVDFAPDPQRWPAALLVGAAG